MLAQLAKQQFLYGFYSLPRQDAIKWGTNKGRASWIKANVWNWWDGNCVCLTTSMFNLKHAHRLVQVFAYSLLILSHYFLF